MENNEILPEDIWNEDKLNKVKEAIINHKKEHFVCEKIKFSTAELAREELERIVAHNYWNKKTPTRYYRCGYHGSEEIWHLTSKFTITKY